MKTEKRERNKQRATANKRLEESRIKKLADYREGKITLCELFKKQRP